ncbi:MAG: hypothetical protein ACJ78Q_19050 [Chloroflexia bacterium]
MREEAKSVSMRADLGRAVALLFLSLVSAGLVSLCGLVWYGFSGVTDKPVSKQIDEQLAMPAVMPYDVEVIEPWGARVATIALGSLLILTALFVLWNAWNFLSIARGRSPAVAGSGRLMRLYMRGGWVLVLFWIVSFLLLVVFNQVIADSSHGIPPYGWHSWYSLL